MVPLVLALGVWLIVISLTTFFIVKNLPEEVETAVAKAAQAEAEAEPISDQQFVQRLEAVMRDYARNKIARDKEMKKVEAKKAGAKKKVKLMNLLPMEKAFYFNNPVSGEGTFVRSLEEFLETLKEAPQVVVDFHLREDANDFENWIRNVVKDVALADELRKIKDQKGSDKEEMIKAIQKKLKARKMLLKSPLKQPKNPSYL